MKDNKLEPKVTEFNTGAKWHPDNEQILYNTSKLRLEHKGDVVEIKAVGRPKLVIRREGSHEEHVLKIPENLIFGDGSWANGGDSVVFPGAEKGGKSDIYMYDMLTHEVRNVSDNPSVDFLPYWGEITFSVSALGKNTTQWAKLKKQK